MSNIIESIEKSQCRSDIPSFKPGDTIRVHAKIIEGDKERIQVFEGVVISRANSGNRASFTVAKFPTESEWSGCSLSTRHGLTKLKSLPLAACVVPNCTTSGIFLEKPLVSKVSVSSHQGPRPLRFQQLDQQRKHPLRRRTKDS